MESIMTLKYTYRLRENHCTDEDGTPVTVSGIEVFEDRSTAPILSYSDLFTRRDQAEELIGLCNRLDLDPVHLNDVVEDAFTLH